MKTKMKKQGGFTLIEMLIVVAIIAILIAISIPLVNKALESSREATDSANLRSAFGIAMAEVMSEDKLAGVDVDATKPNVAYYSIASDAAKQGTLVTSLPAKGAGGAYGKGTKIGNDPNAHVGGTIKVTYDPTATDVEDQFKVEWVDASGNAMDTTPAGP